MRPRKVCDGCRWIGVEFHDDASRIVGEQFEDDGNTLPLAPATLVDLAVHVRIDPHAELFVTAENIADHRLETGRSADDLVNIGSPRLILFGIRSSW
jgi:hypothetical protein